MLIFFVLVAPFMYVFMYGSADDAFSLCCMDVDGESINDEINY